MSSKCGRKGEMGGGRRGDGQDEVSWRWRDEAVVSCCCCGWPADTRGAAELLPMTLAPAACCASSSFHSPPPHLLTLSLSFSSAIPAYSLLIVSESTYSSRSYTIPTPCQQSPSDNTPPHSLILPHHELTCRGLRLDCAKGDDQDNPGEIPDRCSSRSL